MKVFRLRNLVGLAALGGAYAYTRKHGGVKNTFDELMRKKDEMLDQLEAKRSEIASRRHAETAPAQADPTVEDRSVGESVTAETSFPDIPPLGQR